MRLSSNHRLCSRLLLIVALAALAAAPTNTRASSDPRTYTDPLYGYQLDIPADWHTYPPQAGALIGATVMSDIDLDPQVTGDASAVPAAIDAANVKVQLGLAPLPPGQSLAHWAANWIDFQTTDEEFAPLALEFTPPQTITVGQYSGLSYIITEPDGSTVREILLPIDDAQVLVVGIRPAYSARLNDALALLQTMRPNAQFTFPAQVAEVAQSFRARALQTVTRAPRAPMACPTGITNPGTEAPDSPIALFMPFLSGERWMVGGWGYFYGNGTHCNAANEYYSTDWNRSTGDEGAVVLPVADGTIVSAVVPTCPSTGYGCYVRVTHSSGVDTLYAHFSSVTRTSGAVTHSDQIGNVGSTGNSTGSHLHLRFRLNGYSRCYNNGAVCPNGEASLSPQSARPSPMYTASGPQQLVNGGSYTSNNSAQTCYALNAAVNPAGAGTLAISPSPNCNGTQYAIGTTARITATAAAGYAFASWQGDASGTVNPVTVTVVTTRTVTATFVLSGSVVPNDDIADALLIASTPYTATHSTTGATAAADDPLIACAGNLPRYNSVWYRYTPALNSVIEASTIGSAYDTILAVWTGTRGALVNRACNDDASGLQSRVTVTVSAGTEYYMQVAGYTANAAGSLKLAVTTKSVAGFSNKAVYVPMVVR